MAKLFKRLIIIGIIFISKSVIAATSTTNVASTATVTASCGFSAANYTLAFGTYTNSANSYTPATASTVISINCTTGTVYSVSLNAGTTSGATIANRLLNRTTTPTATLPYNIYTTSNYTTVAGNNFVLNATASTATANYPLYGRIFPGLNPAVGNYSDIVTISISY